MMCEEKKTTLLPYPCSERDLVVSSVSHLFWFFSPGLNKKKKKTIIDPQQNSNTSKA
jgi:hypothetical protein